MEPAAKHLAGEGGILTPERGLFLGETWRMRPAITAFTSELFYEGKLEARRMFGWAVEGGLVRGAGASADEASSSLNGKELQRTRRAKVHGRVRIGGEQS